MKVLISILCVIMLWQSSFCQSGTALKIRKIKYDTIFYTQDFVDTTTTYSEINFNPLMESNLQKGTWLGNVFFVDDTLYVFTQLISSRLKKQALKNPKRFWKKINRKKRKKKFTFYSTWYNFNQLDTRYCIKTTTKTFCRIAEQESKKIVYDKKITIDSADTVTNQFVSDYTYLSGYDTVFLNRKVFNINSICRNSRDYTACLFRTLMGNLKGHYNFHHPMGYFKTSSKVAANKYEMYFDFENYLIKKVTVAENKKVKYYCDFDIEKDSIFIMNCPVIELAAGKIGRKNNKIKFRSNNKNYSFYQKYNKNVYLSRFGNQVINKQFSHSELTLVQ